MATNRYLDPVVGEYSVIRRKGMKRLKLSVDHDGKIRVTMPRWAPIFQAKEFVASQRDWLSTKTPEGFQVVDGAVIGKAHTLRIVNTDAQQVTTRLQGIHAFLYVPNNTDPQTDVVIKKARQLCLRALKKETEDRILPRLELFSSSYGTPYASVKVQTLKSRWGSCSSNNDIKLSCFLAQLPEELADYVLTHELCHTIVHAHSSRFWELVATHCPDYKLRRKELKNFRPALSLVA